MNKEYNKKDICDQINKPDCIIKEIHRHRNGDITVRFGKGKRGANMQVTTQDILNAINQLGSKIQELDTKVQALDSKVQALDSKVQALDSKVQALDAKVDAMDSRLTKIENDISLMKNTPTMQRELNLV